MRIEESIVRAWSSRLSRQILDKLVTSLQGMGEDYMLSGDSGLDNVWEEICVQVQGDESADWDSYADTIEGCIDLELGALDAGERLALWSRTEEGWSWIYEHHADSDGAESAPVDPAEITQMLMNELMSMAADYENRNISIFLDGYDPEAEDEDEDDEDFDEDEEDEEDEHEDGDGFHDEGSRQS